MHHIHLVASALLSWTLFVCWTTTPPEPCESGWFGSKCQFKCRCRDNLCDIKGRCLDGGKCLGGWFGPACQYVDLAYRRSPLVQITDGDDDTCINTTVSTIFIPLNGYYIMTWVRITVCKPEHLHNLMFAMGHNGTYVNCSTLSNYAPDKKTRDLGCDFKEPVNSITIADEACLCSLYVSGGRNVALKQPTRQSSLHFSYTSDKAVDGNTDQVLFYESCTHTDNTPWPQWTVTLSSPAIVNRYVIYNREDGSGTLDRLKGFRLTSYDHFGVPVFQFTDVNPTALSIYTVVHADLVIELVEIYTAKEIAFLSLCEVEIYGDSNCTHGYYGLECEKKCNCFSQGKCFVSTGGCLEGCATGYMGEDCNTLCRPEMFGPGCTKSCSLACRRPSKYESTSCDVFNGTCLFGCDNGYFGPACSTPCENGTFGSGCQENCSKFCGRNDSDKTICYPMTGDCVFECEVGYVPPRCDSACPVNTFGAACSKNCSKNCLPSEDTTSRVCHLITGICSHGCIRDFTGLHCNINVTDVPLLRSIVSDTTITVASVMVALMSIFTLLIVAFCIRKNTRMKSTAEKESQLQSEDSTCLPNHYGEDCRFFCSRGCAPSSVSNESPCHHVTGECYNGCSDGRNGTLCELNHFVGVRL